jgi:Chlorophyll A-B binding protein
VCSSSPQAPFWDPAKLALDKPAETIEWYRAAELKHGRVAMLAALGTFVNAAGVALPDSVFQGTTKSFDALAKVADQRPGALIQVRSCNCYV